MVVQVERPEAILWSMNSSKDRVRIILPGEPETIIEMDANALQSLALQAAVQRAEMLPAMPDANPPPGTPLIGHPRGRWYIEPRLETGGLMLALLHPGFGWLALRLDQEGAREVAHQVHRCLFPADGPGGQPN